jgi:hypothetical protein
LATGKKVKREELVWTRPRQVVPYSDIENILREDKDALVFVEDLKKQTAHDAAYRIGRRLGFKVRARLCSHQNIKGYAFFREND